MKSCSQEGRCYKKQHHNAGHGGLEGSDLSYVIADKDVVIGAGVHLIGSPKLRLLPKACVYKKIITQRIISIDDLRTDF